MTAYPHLGFDPVRADEGTGATIAGTLRRTVHRLGEANDVLSGSGDQDWKGQTAEAFRGTVAEELRPRVAEAHQAFAQASRAFDRWVDDLPGYRRRADALEEEARQTAQRVESAAGALSGLESPGPDADDAARDEHDARRSTLRTALTAREGELTAVLDRARALRSEVEQHAGEVATAFGLAMDAAPDEPGLFGRIGEALKKVGEALGEAFDWFMENLAPLIQQLARIIGAVATILAMVAFVVGFVFPPAFALAGTLGTIAKVASLVDLGIQGLRVLHGEDGALQGFLLQGAGMLLGIGMAKAIGPIAINAQTNIRNGPFVPVLAGISRGTGGAAATATVAIKVNPDFYHSLAYWGVTNYRSLTGALTTLDQESRR